MTRVIGREVAVRVAGVVVVVGEVPLERGHEVFRQRDVLRVIAGVEDRDADPPAGRVTDPIAGSPTGPKIVAEVPGEWERSAAAWPAARSCPARSARKPRPPRTTRGQVVRPLIGERLDEIRLGVGRGRHEAGRLGGGQGAMPLVPGVGEGAAHGDRVAGPPRRGVPDEAGGERLRPLAIGGVPPSSPPRVANRLLPQSSGGSTNCTLDGA